MIKHEYVKVTKHPSLPLYLYKYTQECVFESKWDEFTLKSRGLILDEEDNVVANCIPKFFNIEDHAQQCIPKLNFDQPFSVTQKDDGSLIQVFIYEGQMVVSSSGGFENDYTRKAEQLLNTKYQHLLPLIQTSDRVNFIFEMIAPLTKVVVHYGDKEELRLITIRDKDGNEPEDFIQQCIDLGFDHVESVKFNSIDELVAEKSGKYNNLEGFVVKFADGSRVKAKYNDYFILHKTITHLTKHTVWEQLMNNDDEINEDFLANLPDETFDQIKEWEAELNIERNKLIDQARVAYQRLHFCNTRKEYANEVMSKYKDLSKILFAMYDYKDITEMIWKYIEPKNIV